MSGTVPPKRILVVDDNADMRRMLRYRLSLAGYAVTEAASGEEMLRKVKDVVPDLIILDIVMPGMDGMAAKIKMNEDPDLARVPVIFLSGKDQVGDRVSALGSGADDYITKPFESREMLARVGAILAKRGIYEKMSMTDALTGLFNRQYFQKELDKMFRLSKRYGYCFSLVMLDIDDLKMVNDGYGHLTGDIVLKETARVIKNTVRETDIAARYGGDEFMVLLPYAGKEETDKAALRLRDSLDKARVKPDGGDGELFIPASLGYAVWEPRLDSPEQLVRSADAAMYADKRSRKREK
jgi:diguanylate cyclase (GGDEF)-like protein